MSGSDTTRMMIDRINSEQREWKSKRSGIDKKTQPYNEFHKEDDYSYLFEDDESMPSDFNTIDDGMDSFDTPVDDTDDDLPDALKRFDEFLDQSTDNREVQQPSTQASNAQVTAQIFTANQKLNQNAYIAQNDFNDNDFDSFDDSSNLSDVDDVIREGQRIPAGFDVLGESNVVQHDGQQLARHIRVLLDEMTGVEYLMFTDERGITVVPRYNADGTLRTGAIIDTVF